jgi:hypothetical protein
MHLTSRPPRRSALEWLTPAVLTIVFVTVAVAGVPARYGLAHLAVLAVIYALLSVALTSGSRLLWSLGPALGWAGAACFAFVFAWHLREQTSVPRSVFAVVPVSLLLTPVFAAVARLPRGLAGWRVQSKLFAVSALGFAATFFAAYTSSAVLRWHLLRHNTMLGTPAYYLLEKPTSVREAELFASHRREDGAGSAAAGPSIVAAGSGRRPNIVFILLDTLRADALAAWGGDRALMTNLNNFLDGAFRFTDVIASSSWTRPSMGSFFTGLLPEEHGARDVGDALGESQVTLAESLRMQGYSTLAFVTNLAAIGEGTGFAQGFDRYIELGGEPYAKAEAVNRAVRRWLDGEPRRQAGVFLYLHYLDPHEPYLSGGNPFPKSRSEYLAAYRAELEYLDRQLGELFAILEGGLPGPTVFLIASDHGEEFFEHQLFGHGHSLYQELIHVPVALRPAEGSGGDLAARLESRDFFELLLRLGAGEEVAVAEWSRLRSRNRRYASIYYSQTGRLILRPYLRKTLMRMVDESGVKLIWSGFGDTLELYDLSVDGGETFNLAAERAAEAGRLAGSLDELVRQWTFGEAFEPSGEVLEQLKALGYLDG